MGSENSFRLKMSYVVETTVSMLTAKAPGPMALFSAIETRWASWPKTPWTRTSRWTSSRTQWKANMFMLPKKMIWNM